jgi:hypothetical protein
MLKMVSGCRNGDKTSERNGKTRLSTLEQEEKDRDTSTGERDQVHLGSLRGSAGTETGPRF